MPPCHMIEIFFADHLSLQNWHHITVNKVDKHTSLIHDGVNDWDKKSFIVPATNLLFGAGSRKHKLLRKKPMQFVLTCKKNGAGSFRQLATLSMPYFL